MTKQKRLEIALSNASKFSSYEVALKIAQRRDEKVLLGDNGQYLSVSTRDAIKLASAGYEII